MNNVYNPNNYKGFTVQTTVTGSRVAGTVYQNTGKTPMLVTVVASSGVAGVNKLIAYAASGAAPSTQVGYYQKDATLDTGIGSISFVVLPFYYYKVVAVGTIALGPWTEWV